MSCLSRRTGEPGYSVAPLTALQVTPSCRMPPETMGSSGREGGGSVRRQVGVPDVVSDQDEEPVLLRACA